MYYPDKCTGGPPATWRDAARTSIRAVLNSFSHTLDMEEPPPQAGGAAAAAEGSLLLGAISQTENAVNENSIDGAGGSSEDEAAGPVQELGGVEDESGTEQEEAGEGGAAPAAADGPAAAGAISENGGGTGVQEKRKRGRPRKDAAGAAAGAAAVAAPAKHDAVWAPINVMLPREQHIWEGVMGPTYHGERWRSLNLHLFETIKA